MRMARDAAHVRPQGAQSEAESSADPIKQPQEGERARPLSLLWLLDLSILLRYNHARKMKSNFLSVRSTCSRKTCNGLANRLGLELRVAHYPPYCSKHNPIEHRVFPHVTRACQGVIFHTVEIAKQFIERTKTSTGLHVTVSILDKVYATGRKYAAGLQEQHEDPLRRPPPEVELPHRPATQLKSGNHSGRNPTSQARVFLETPALSWVSLCSLGIAPKFPGQLSGSVGMRPR